MSIPAKDYMVCNGDTPMDLAAIVKLEIGNGWIPLGGIAVAVTSWNYENGKGEQTHVHSEYVQAMVR